MRLLLLGFRGEGGWFQPYFPSLHGLLFDAQCKGYCKGSFCFLLLHPPAVIIPVPAENDKFNFICCVRCLFNPSPSDVTNRCNIFEHTKRATDLALSLYINLSLQLEGSCANLPLWGLAGGSRGTADLAAGGRVVPSG